MQKAFDPESFESRLYGWWSERGCFRAEDESRKPSFSIAMPPPNITGALHNGHALFVTIEDVLTRWKRMSGFNTLWLPGTDHAGIATQMVVERELAKQGLKRQEMGRKAFLAKVWEWKEKHGNIIVDQMKRLGGSPDWSRLQFTMDPGLSKAVRHVFVTLFEQGLIYRGTRIINWCTRCQTALSDLEVTPTDRKGHFWHLKYVPTGGGEALVIATTRPETLLGDAAVAVHPEDDRYKKLIGKKVKLPLLGREIPVIADSYVDREFGSGALKVTPGHDFNDYDIGKRHNLEIISVFDKTGKVNEHGGVYQGLSIPEAREKILIDLEAQGLLVRTEDHAHSVGVCQRCERVAEPMVSDQWFMNVKPLAEKAIEAARKGEKLTLEEVDKRDDAIKFLPEGWVNTYYQWMENIRDWCVSRQLWWGHQIPAWYCHNGHITVSRDDATKCATCSSTKMRQDDDVLDTWFSSGLWPFTTLGWPEKTKAYERFYPTAVMETGFDILFFWVARMIMMGMHFNDGKVPFKRVYLHAMVRDEKGQKMSKTKGNVIDPLDIIKEYGADAFRFTLSIMAGQGRDVKLSLDRVEGYKAFCNKLWNASRYVLMRLGHVASELPGDPLPKADFQKITGGKPLAEWVSAGRAKFHPINRWILAELDRTIAAVESGLEEFRLNESSQALYDFVWGQYCDWYIEFSKELLQHSEFISETQGVMMHVLEQALKLSHPFIPFITEEIYQHLPERPGVEKGAALMLATFPKRNARTTPEAEQAIEMVAVWKASIEKLRAFRGENNISPKARPKITYEVSDRGKADAFIAGVPVIRALAQLESLEAETGYLRGNPTTGEVLSGTAKFFIPLKGLVDVDGELKRVEKEKQTTLADIEFTKSKLAKPTFIEKAPKELIDKEKDKLRALETRVADLDHALGRLRQLK
ncbi:MAG: valine--tRNA ligase [Deltaproteobacteria bacterium]|nr:valine--tRNA ligase [Deltaproteobacteria bacterium]